MKKKILNKSRLRVIQGGFAFIPHRFLTDGFIEGLSSCEILLYFFLTLASDACGISYWSDRSICRLLKLSQTDLIPSRRALIDKDLICFDPPLYQVLELPDKPKDNVTAALSPSPSSFSRLIQTLED